MCGHYNDEQEDDFRMNDGQRSGSLKQFHKSYTLKNQECEESNWNKFYQDRDSDEFEIEKIPRRRMERKSWLDSSDESDSKEIRRIDSDESRQSRERGERGERRSPVKRTKVMGECYEIFAVELFV